MLIPPVVDHVIPIRARQKTDATVGGTSIAYFGIVEPNGLATRAMALCPEFLDFEAAVG